MTTPTPRRPQAPQPPGAARTGFWAGLGRDLRDALLEILLWAVAVAVLVGGAAAIGSALGGGIGMIVGGVVGAIVLGGLWLSLVIAGVSLAARVLRRSQAPKP